MKIMKRKLKKKPKIILIIVSIILILGCIYFNGIGSVSNKSKKVVFEIEQGDTYSSIAKTLKENKLIKSEFFYKVYIKILKPASLQAGIYDLNQNMDVQELVENLSKGTTSSDSLINITFKEGINMRAIVNVITKNTNIKEDEIYSLLKDETYLDELINNYWFIDNSIKNKNIYYSLEGYLFPDTYQVDKNGSLKDIFKVMLNNMKDKLEPYKKDIENSKYSVHELLTLASIVEMEAANSDDRYGVAGVFYNRLNGGWSLGSDVTTYYGAKIDVSERDLYQKEIDEYNDYNTRNAKMAGKLPISPICIPSLESIKAVINPTKHSYYYFVADKNKKTYFSVTEGQHVAKVAQLKRDGLWYQY